MKGGVDGSAVHAVARRSTRRTGAALIICCLVTGPVVTYSQELPPTHEAPRWSYFAIFDFYLLSNDSDYLQPTIKVDRGAFHLEGRYNYEDFETGALLIGRKFGLDNAVEFEIIPMIGAVFGNTNGLAPAVSLRLAWNRIELYNESEYVVDRDDEDYNFLFAWTEAVIWPTQWLRIGLAEQRTHPSSAPADVAPGLLVGLAFKRAGGSLYLFDPGDGERYAIIGFEVSF